MKDIRKENTKKSKKEKKKERGLKNLDREDNKVHERKENRR